MKISAFFNFLELEARFNIEKTKVIDIVIKSIAIESDTRGETVEKSPVAAAIFISSSPAPMILKRKITPSNPKTALKIFTIVF